ncbi:hypothetical protein GpartN1_g2501.t1 [Galdieria partita]|uniref:60S ribosomal protein L35a n=1 Tax=Galdieria partita TaxID=83374 RepID=A0A9C7PUS6_9RHOD|nr:hypothetical protein GpartN1_g1397.t1 [Galdieria partita]GJQ10710.1 hypothetical protein GpartN1_g2501.t1 [Galdieria partita]
MSQKSSGRLYCKGVVLGYKRSLRNQYPNQTRIKIQGVEDRVSTNFYIGKRVAYVYRAKKPIKSIGGKKTKVRVIWGKIIAPHGNRGVVRAKFRNNLPPSSFGKRVRVMLYPSNV